MCGVARRDNTEMNTLESDNKTGASVQGNYRKTTEVVRPCEENERRVRIMLDVDILWKRRRGRPNLRWKDACKRDMTQAGLKEDKATENNGTSQG